MKIIYLKNEEIDKSRWDEAIARSYNGIIYAYSHVLDIFCDKWDALVAEDYSYVMPLPRRRKYFVDYIYQPIFIQQLGVFSSEIIESHIVEEFISCIPANFRWVDVNFNTYNSHALQNVGGIPYVTHELDLIMSWDNLKAGFSENTRRNIKKAEKAKLYLTRIAPSLMVSTFLRENKGKLSEIKLSDYQNVQKLMEWAMSRGKAVATAAYTPDEKLCAAAFFIESNGKVIFLFSVSTALGKEHGAMHFLIADFIKSNSQLSLTLDFEGSMVDSLARFYKGFGAKSVHYYKYKKNKLPFIGQLLRK